VSHGAVRIDSASGFAASHRANLATGTVRVLSTDRHAHSLSAAFVDQTLGVGRAQRTTDGILTGESGSAALGSGARCWLSDAGLQ
jgi:hypothetical protein